MKEVEVFYTQLYTKDLEVENDVTARATVLSYVTTEVTVQQNEELVSYPGMDELEGIVKRLPDDKAPGLDGATTEILVKCWKFMKQDCLDMLLSFCSDGILAACDCRGVIKLLPKNQERQRLRNWRPITLLTLTYKLISKVLAGRLKKILPGLVDEHQTGFVDGRSIHESILLHRITQEYAAATRQEVVLLKLDFEKAYDRVSHAYLGAVLQQMNFSTTFINLIQELTIKATEENYQKAKETLQLYEAAAGAKLNVRKSVMVPVSISEVPLLMTRSGCRIAAKGELVLHLGFPGGDSITEAQACYYSLESLWRTFIWGTRDDGKAKNSSLAWDIMQGSGLQGGAQIMSLTTHSDACKVRQIACILEGGSPAWTNIAKVFLRRDMMTGSQRSEMRRWTPEEMLLLGPKVNMKESKSLRHLLKPWYKVREFLTFSADESQLSESLTVKQLVIIVTKKAGVCFTDEPSLMRALKRALVGKIADLHPAGQPWRRFREDAGNQMDGVDLQSDVNRLLEWVGRIEIVATPLQACSGWS
ncbi:hypothetical protein R1sor_001136 [Riccia sorocarpa]|uniref:Reverse transcriptase domain-containing protein n=1 Tax=Riccia sorocarpa TaxID=122646 RepID=A0ABD3GXN7_9MARC